MTTLTVTIAGRSYPVRAAVYQGRLVDLGTAVEMLNQREDERRTPRRTGVLRRFAISMLTFG